MAENNEQHTELESVDAAGSDAYLTTLRGLQEQFPHKSAAELNELAERAASDASDAELRKVVGVQPGDVGYDSMASASLAIEAKDLEPKIVILRQKLDAVQAELEEARQRNELDKDSELYERISELNATEIKLQDELEHLESQHRSASVASRLHAHDAKGDKDMADAA